MTNRVVQVTQPIVVATGSMDTHFEYVILTHSAAAWKSRRASLQASRRLSVEGSRLQPEPSEDATCVQRRFRDFVLLRRALKTLAANEVILLPKLPRRTLLRDLSTSFGAGRQYALQEWLRTVAACHALWCDDLCSFLGLSHVLSVVRQSESSGLLFDNALQSMFHDVTSAWNHAIVAVEEESAPTIVSTSPTSSAVRSSDPPPLSPAVDASSSFKSSPLSTKSLSPLATPFDSFSNSSAKIPVRTSSPPPSKTPPLLPRLAYPGRRRPTHRRSHSDPVAQTVAASQWAGSGGEASTEASLCSNASSLKVTLSAGPFSPPPIPSTMGIESSSPNAGVVAGSSSPNAGAVAGALSRSGESGRRSSEIEIGVGDLLEAISRALRIYEHCGETLSKTCGASSGATLSKTYRASSGVTLRALM